ncbi:hypothetical protein QAD02_019391 [Eretmocerus hayati]|uniref:Uncharacterized protein n=1 Tax=Eretmocerus hayati TaxID=131215 RepID=A0ACC2PLY9_9HYME|nr:hypothetical protein QAD02_019391 [Eretmocerus hayati]
MCSTEMTETAYSMSPSAASTTASAGCLGSSPPRQMSSSSPLSEEEDDGEISVGCPSPLPLVVSSHSVDERDEYSRLPSRKFRTQQQHSEPDDEADTGQHHSSLQQSAQAQHQNLKRKSSQSQGASGGGHNGKRTPGQGSPLDALFQMTSKTFDAGEHSQGRIEVLLF